LTQFCLDHSTVGILWLNWDSRVRYANQAAEVLLGHSSGGLLDHPLETFDPALGMDAWLARWGGLASPVFTVTHLTLFESYLGRGGATYEPIARWPFGT